MKFILLTLILCSNFSYVKANSEAKAIQIQGAAADYLYSFDKRLDMTTCYLAIQRSGKSVPECELYVMDVSQESRDIIIDGFAAREMYRLKIRSESVSCYTTIQTNGSSNVECRLKAKIVGRN